MIVSGSSWPDENLTEPRGVASPIDIAKKRTDPVKNANSHAAGMDTGSTGGCAPRANRKVPSVTKSNQVMERVAIALLTCGGRSEEHTSELQSHSDLVCRLLLE